MSEGDMEAAVGLSPGGVLGIADARRFDRVLERAARSRHLDVRRAAFRALGWLRDPAAASVLESGLRDPDPEVRGYAAYGLGALEAGAGAGSAERLLGALAGEEDPANQSRIIWDLGRIGSDSALPALRRGLADSAATNRAAACEALGSYGMRERTAAPGLLRRAAARAADDPDRDVRLACTFALGRLPPPVAAPDDARAIVADLGRAAADEDPEVRAMAVRALGRTELAPVELLAERTGDADWRVAIQAFRALARRVEGGSDGPFAAALRRRLDRSLAGSGGPDGHEAHVLVVAFEAGASVARRSSTHGVAVEAFERLSQPVAEGITKERALAHCAAERLVDLGRGWPSRLGRCGFGQLDGWRKVAMAEILGKLEGKDRDRAVLLERYFVGGDSRVRQAAMMAAVEIRDPKAHELLLRGLEAEDPGVAGAAVEALARLGARFRATGDPELEPPPIARLKKPLSKARGVLSQAHHPAALLSFLDATDHLGSRALAEDLAVLAKYDHASVRRRAREVLERFKLPAPKGEDGAVRSGASHTEVPEEGEATSVIFETDRGELELEVLMGVAPRTAAAFLGLVDAGFYDGTTFHQVLPGFVVQGGDPRGDGHGGPGWSLRCEDGRTRFERGTVGLSLGGRDTGGSQFFVTLSRQAHLDGRYTAIARVVRGLEILDLVQPGDALTRARRLQPSSP